MSTLDYQRRKRFINAVVEDTKLTYKETSEAASLPNNREIVMPVYKPDFTEEQDQHFMSELLQKCYHAMPDNIEDSKQSLDPEKPFTQAHNIVCRHNAQNKRQGILPGADNYLVNDSDIDARRFVQALNAGAQYQPELEAVKAFDIIARNQWQTSSDYGVREAISPQAQTMLDKMLNDDSLLSSYLEGRSGGEANIEMTKRLIEEATDEENAEQMQQEAQAGSESKEGEGEGKPQGGRGGEEGDGEGEEGKGESEEKGTSEQAQYDPMHEHVGGFDVNQIGNNQTLSYPEDDFEGEFVAAEHKVIVPKGAGEGWGARRSDVEGVMTDTLSKKVRNILKVYSQARYAGGKKKGKINKRALASITTGNDRIFRQKEVKDVLDTSVMLLVDTSGSMCGDRYTHAVAATAMLNDCLSKLNIPHAVYGFTYSSRKNIMYEHKRFNQSTTQEDIITSMCSEDVDMSGNDDGDAVLYAHDKLIKQKQKRKILIVLSDGQPTDPPRMGRKYLKHITNEITTKSPVELYGLGIQTDSVKEYYTQTEIIHNCNNLESTLLTLLKDSIVA